MATTSKHMNKTLLKIVGWGLMVGGLALALVALDSRETNANPVIFRWKYKMDEISIV